MDILFELPLKQIRIIYTAPTKYFPEQNDELNEENLSFGIKKVTTLSNFNGVYSVGYPYFLITFLGFSAIRARSVYNYYQPASKLGIAAIPLDPSLYWRVELSKKINEFDYSNSEPITEWTGFDYVKIYENLERVYEQYSSNYNLGIACFGSKLQALAAFLFLKKHKDIQAVFSIPKYFDAKKYSEGIGDSWEIIFNLEKLKTKLI